LASEYRRLSADPGLLREECRAEGPGAGPVIIDEIQKLPELLDEVHALISRDGFQFILCGSSARKLVRGGGNLLGGRAVRMDLYPLASIEVPDLSLGRALSHGLLPEHYLSDDPSPLLEAYVGQYLREEILAESLTRNLPAFQRFLETAAFSNGQTVNFSSIAREVGGISSPSVRAYFDILVDTLIGCWLPAWVKRAKRRVVESPRFYFFDVGIVNELARREAPKPGSVEYGAAFEHFIFMELRAYVGYRKPRLALTYWRTSSGFEVDFILGNAKVAVEVKSTGDPTRDHLKGLRAWRSEHPSSRCFLVCRAPRSRKTEDDIDILPWDAFLTKLWSGEIVSPGTTWVSRSAE
jgi:predicted AAA+ superfamily ATPase